MDLMCAQHLRPVLSPEVAALGIHIVAAGVALNVDTTTYASSKADLVGQSPMSQSDFSTLGAGAIDGFFNLDVAKILGRRILLCCAFQVGVDECLLQEKNTVAAKRMVASVIRDGVGVVRSMPAHIDGSVAVEFLRLRDDCLDVFVTGIGINVELDADGLKSVADV